MPANQVEAILLEGFPVTGVTDPAEQPIMTEGFSAGEPALGLQYCIVTGRFLKRSGAPAVGVEISFRSDGEGPLAGGADLIAGDRRDTLFTDEDGRFSVNLIIDDALTALESGDARGVRVTCLDARIDQHVTVPDLPTCTLAELLAMP